MSTVSTFEDDGGKREARALGAFIRRKLKERGMNARMLSLQSGLNQNTLAPYIKGTITRPDVRTLQRIAGPLKVSFEALCRIAADIPEEPGDSTIVPALAGVLAEYDARTQGMLAEVLPQLMGLALQLAGAGAPVAAARPLSPEEVERQAYNDEVLGIMAGLPLPNVAAYVADLRQKQAPSTEAKRVGQPPAAPPIPRSAAW